MGQLGEAAAYLASPAATRDAQPVACWEAFHQVVGGELKKPDWPVAGPGGGSQEAAARKELAEELADLVVAVGECCTEVRNGWREAAAAEVDWRERQEAGRERLRLVLRAWREATDGLQAGAAAWEQRWRRGEECGLGKRLAFPVVLPEGNVSGEPIHVVRQGWQEKAWAARFVLTWMRLIRAGVVRAKRRRSKEYLERQVEREKRLFYSARPRAQSFAATVRDERVGEWVQQRRRQQQQQQQRQRKDEEASSADSSTESDSDGAVGDRVPLPAANLHAISPEKETEVRRTRRTDGVLKLTNQALAAMTECLGGGETRLVNARRKRGDG